jgi:hypothetical protein
MKPLHFGPLLVLIEAPRMVLGLTSYANEFVTPDFFLEKNWPDVTKYARDTIVEGARQIAAEGPWGESMCVSATHTLANGS